MAKQTYADIRNSRFSNKSSHFVDLVERLDSIIDNLPRRAQANWNSNLKKAIAAFKKQYPNLRSFDRKNFRLVQATEIPLNKIVIDTTMQREPDLSWVLNIIENFRAYQAQPVQVYATADGRWGGWDGQHTALALYLIARDVFGIDITQDAITVPANVYNITNRGEIRNNFIVNNSFTGKGAGKKALDTIDIFEQKIYGVEVDGVQDPDWVDAWRKWQHIKSTGMFLTADKFKNTEEPGAISRLNEINDYGEEEIRQFCVYGRYVVDLQQRAIETKEIPLITELFHMCEQEDIKWNDTIIEDLAQHLIDKFDANFDGDGPFWHQCHQANVNAWSRNNKALGIPQAAWGDEPRNNKNVPIGISFLWHQLMHTWVPRQAKGFRFPKKPQAIYTPDVRDLL